MKVLKSHIQLTALVLSFVFTNTVLAAESTTDESKDSGAANTTSNADLTNNAGNDTATPVAQNVDSESASSVAQTDAAVNEQPVSQEQSINDVQSYRKQMDERRQQVQEAQQQAYNRFLEQRKQNTAAFNNNIPADVQERRKEFMKQMEERRALNISADITNNADSESASSVAQTDAALNEQPVSQAQSINDVQSYRKQMDERRQQVQEAQQQAYNRFLEQRKQNTAAFNSNIPADVQERRKEFMKQMEERRALNIKMMEEHRKAAEERRAAMQQKMQRTSTMPESAGKA